MPKRKSIGADPLDWIGEPTSMAKETTLPARENGTDTHGKDSTSADLPEASAQELLSLSNPTNPLQLERQLLMMNGLSEEESRRPAIIPLLLTLLVFLAFLGAGMLLYQESRRQWGERISLLEGTIDRIEENRGYNERLLHQVIDDKDELIREKHETICRMDAIHESTAGELRLARLETHRIRSSNQDLLEQVLMEINRKREPATTPENSPGIEEPSEETQGLPQDRD